MARPGIQRIQHRNLGHSWFYRLKSLLTWITTTFDFFELFGKLATGVMFQWHLVLVGYHFGVQSIQVSAKVNRTFEFNLVAGSMRYIWSHNC